MNVSQELLRTVRASASGRGRATVLVLNVNHSRRQRIREVEETFGLYPPAD
jgi:hypothetical protein